MIDGDLILRAVLVGCGGLLLWGGLTAAERLFGYRQAPQRTWRTLAIEVLLLAVSIAAMCGGLVLVMIGLFGDVEVK